MSVLAKVLPSWAIEHRSMRAGSENDIGAYFYEDYCDGIITVEIQRLEGGDLNLNISRSGLSESRFSADEMQKVVELLNIITAYIGRKK